MNDLFKKLNVLVKSSLRDAAGVSSGEDQPPRPPKRLGKGIDREIATLRDRINEAVRYEEEIKTRIQRYADEADRWDREADAAVARSDDAAARYAIEHMQRAQQRVTIAEADLRDHQLSTEDLIQRVNELDAAVADARREHPEAAENSPLPDLANVLREAREKITSLGELVAARADVSASTETPAPDLAAQPAPPSESQPQNQPAPAETAVDDDLARRRARLSKR